MGGKEFRLVIVWYFRCLMRDLFSCYNWEHQNQSLSLTHFLPSIIFANIAMQTRHFPFQTVLAKHNRNRCNIFHTHNMHAMKLNKSQRLRVNGNNASGYSLVTASARLAVRIEACPGRSCRGRLCPACPDSDNRRRNPVAPARLYTDRLESIGRRAGGSP